MNEKTKSLIRHALTAVGTVIALLGLNSWIPILDYVSESFDGVWAAIEVLVGFVITVYGFIRNDDRHEVREATTNTVG